MYIAIFDIEEISNAVKLTSFFQNLDFEVSRKENEVHVSAYREDAICNVLQQGNLFLDQLEAVYESWHFYKEDERENTVVNPYDEYGVSESFFY